MTKRLQDAILERKLLLFILDCETDLGTICIDDGFCGA
jgi:hypothetical protein